MHPGFHESFGPSGLAALLKDSKVVEDGPGEPLEALEQPDILVGGGEEGSLQDNFKRFRKKRQADKREAQKAVELANSARASPQYKQTVRKLFIETAKKYLGAPYAQRYHDPVSCECEGCTEREEQLFHAPPFLDCCALVRRCVADLQEHFGFKLGRGNQAYQFDTLPVRVQSVAELEPGDLIFYEGKYYSTSAKQQLHDIVHVEIFTGGESGEAVIGSRERFKWVKEYESYRIDNSARWKLIAYHFAKIDTWLEGTLQSFCSEHTWEPANMAEAHRLRDAPTKSIFTADTENEAASDDDC
ncbi:hypothetical protein CYMTET_49802 [Cymbomonas tetramitiformis]|uniref:Uncharacterized protein n=1 Tax=Cymbomonas tetramitiformis TaxID=36881 RepID=A0AAE0ETI3_9CHLO|nr:hypothetical protein CYMTET_49802 [Cymbomonas tetramitiformis]